MSELDLIFSKRKKIEEEKKEEKVNETEIETSKEKEEDIEQQAKSSNNLKIDDKQVEEIMKKFTDKDPKIGIWSYPSYLLLQYLYNTIPGFKMSKVAREALEKGLREMYPELFKIAEKVAKEAKKI